MSKITLRGKKATQAIAGRFAGFGAGVYFLDDCPDNTVAVAVMPGDKIIDLGRIKFQPAKLKNGDVGAGHVVLEDGTEAHFTGKVMDFARYRIEY